MRIFALIPIFLFCGCKAYPQKSPCEKVYQIVDEMPVYKGGYKDLSDDVNKLKIKEGCKAEELQRIIWVIDEQGKIASVEVVGPDNDECENYVVEYAKTFTDWKPGKLKGKPVCVKMVYALHIRSSN